MSWAVSVSFCTSVGGGGRWPCRCVWRCGRVDVALMVVDVVVGGVAVGGVAVVAVVVWCQCCVCCVVFDGVCPACLCRARLGVSWSGLDVRVACWPCGGLVKLSPLVCVLGVLAAWVA